MADDNSTRSFPMTIGLWGLIEELQLQVPPPATRSEIVAGARKTIAADEEGHKQAQAPPI